MAGDMDSELESLSIESPIVRARKLPRLLYSRFEFGRFTLWNASPAQSRAMARKPNDAEGR